MKERFPTTTGHWRLRVSDEKQKGRTRPPPPGRERPWWKGTRSWLVQKRRSSHLLPQKDPTILTSLLWDLRPGGAAVRYFCSEGKLKSLKLSCRSLGIPICPVGSVSCAERKPAAIFAVHKLFLLQTEKPTTLLIKYLLRPLSWLLCYKIDYKISENGCSSPWY